MKKLFLTLTSAITLCSCSILSNVNWNAEKIASAAGKAMTAASISDEQIVQLCQQSIAALDRQNKIDNGAYIKRLKGLMQNVAIDGLPLNLKVYQTEEVNAFASGDGSIRVYSGLMDVMDDDELMAIIGHEIGHVVHQDTKNAMKKAYLASAASDLLGSAGSVGAIAQATLGSIGEAFVSAQYSQKQEFAADEYGFNFATRYGHTPYSMCNALQKLVNLSTGTQASKVAQMFASHPDSAERAQRAKAMADSYKK